MSRKRFFFPSPLAIHKRHELTEEEKHYLTRVLRLKAGDEVELFDGCGKEGIGVLAYGEPKRLEIQVVSVQEREERKFDLIFCLSLPKGNKMDLIVQKTTELGVTQIIPLITRRSVSRPKGLDGEKRLIRWERIAREAARQSRRAFIPEISPILSYEALLKRGCPPDFLPLLLWEEEGEDLKNIIRKQRPERLRGAMVIVGPEGGFDRDEVHQARERGFIPVWLGHHVLRTETAAIVICALIQFTLGDFFSSGKEQVS